MRGIKNWIGRTKGYSGCYHCAGTWNWKRPYYIPYREGCEMFPLCKECFEKLDTKTTLDYCKKLMADWKKWHPLDFDEKEAVRTIENFIKEKKSIGG